MKKRGTAGEEEHGNLEDLIEVDFTLTHINIHTDLVRKKTTIQYSRSYTMLFAKAFSYN